MPTKQPTSRVPVGFEEHAGDRQFATTLARGLELLGCFTPEKPVLGNRELAERLQLPSATVSRLTYTLQSMGYLDQAGPQGKYQLGSAVLSLGYPLLAQFKCRRVARPLMMELARKTGGTVSIGIRDRLSMVYIEVARANQRLYNLDAGTRHTMAGTAMGRAFLMGCLPSEREAIINQIQVKAPQEWAQFGASVLENVRQFPRYGCCVSIGEVIPGVQAVAVPIGRIDRGEVASLSCAFHVRPLDADWLRKEIAPQLTALAGQLV